MSHFLYSKNRAFTLAEALITILVVGIVSAVVIPALHDGFSKNVFQASFSDSYKNFNKGLYNYTISIGGKRAEKQADGTTKEVSSVASMHDGTITSSHLFDDGSVTQKLADQFKGSACENNCWGDDVTITNSIDGKNSAGTTDLSDVSGFISGNGFIYAIEMLSNTCALDLRADTTQRHKLSNSCAILYMDVNGKQPPNTFGKDVYALIITNSANNSLYPVGGDLIDYDKLNNTKINGVDKWCTAKDNGNCTAGTCDNTNGKDGRSCAGRIIEEGMRIRYLK